MGFQKKKYMVSSDVVTIVEEHWNFFFILSYSLKKTLKPIVFSICFVVLVCALQLGDVLKFNNLFFSKSAFLFFGGL